MAPVPRANAATYPTLKPGMSGDAVKALQVQLVKRGYLSLADGKYGSGTATAVKLFQKHARLTQTGIADNTTQVKLYGLTGDGKTNLTLKADMNSSEVAILQKRLIALNYLAGMTVTTHFGSFTKSAVILFQRKVGLTADGVAGPMTLVKLYSSSTAKYTGNPVDASALKVGMSGDAVLKLQTNLKKRGYLKSADGQFGSGTLAAVKLFQQHEGLTADGIAGKKTQDLLYALVGSGKTNLTLKSGSTGTQVQILQQRLIDLGYLRGVAATTTFGTATKSAVVKFQTKVGLTADGAAGPKTLVRLYSPTAPKYLTNGEKAVQYARQFLGVKYVYGAADPSVGFDCSGLIYYIYKHYFGITLPRTAQGMTKAGTGVALKDAKPGDILCFGTSVSDVGHVGLYIGNNQYIEAPQTGDVVKITTLKRAVATVRRIFTNDN